MVTGVDSPTTAGIDYLRTSTAIRERCGNILAAVRAGKSKWFAVNDAGLQDAADVVARVTLQRYPSLKTPYHSRWRHFEPGGVDRLQQLNAALGNCSLEEKARAHVDLVIVSVLLDAGAGAAWKYKERASHQTFTRSEGLGIASFHAFMKGLFSANPRQPLRVDAQALRKLSAERLAVAFQVTANNPLVGVEGRAILMQRLGDALIGKPQWFGAEDRPGSLFDALSRRGGALPASAILDALLQGLASIWPSGNVLKGTALGDCWQHPLAGGKDETAGWVPLHKLSQWMTYSLLEPFEWAGIKVTELDALTGLAEYRNGGLLVDAGALLPKHPSLLAQAHLPSSEPIIEWRALTVALLDELAPLVRTRLGTTAQTMPLACILEGGTWAAGRVLAQEKRGGEPPIRIISDGTVF